MLNNLSRLFIFAFLISATAGADVGDGVSYTIHHHYVAPRALGMGDAFVAVADDYNALFYNPAGLARREEGEVNLHIDLAGTPSLLKLSKDLETAQKTEGSDADKQRATLEVIEQNYGKTFGARVSPLNGIWVRPGWGVGFIPLDLSLELTMHRQVGPAINTTVYGDTTLGLGWAKDVFWIPHSRTSIGVTGKFVNRAYFSQPVNFIELAADSNVVRRQDLREGYTVDADIGVLYTPELPDESIWSLLRLARPTFGAVVRNVGEIGFARSLKLINKESEGAPEKLHRVLDVGTKWEYPSVWIFGGRGVMDFRDIGHPAFNWRKGFHLGFEFDWTMASWWRGQYRVGVNQGYFTAGASAMFGIFNLDLVTYGEDVGTYSKSQQNRIYMARLNMNF